MKILLVCPASQSSRSGNRVTSARWARILRHLGHTVRVGTEYRTGKCDALIALHARKSARSIRRFRRLHPRSPLIVALTGTDLYRNLSRSSRARASVEAASALVVLQSAAMDELPEELRRKTRVIYQSAQPLRNAPKKSRDSFLVVVLGHLRREKDPFRAAFASRRLPAASRIRVVHAGRSLSPQMTRRARAEMKQSPRYCWIGETTHTTARRWLARSHLMVLSSRMEGGANVLSEAIVQGVPVITSRIPGSVGILGKDYPGYFQVGDTRALSALLKRAEADPTFYARLLARTKRIVPLLHPDREKSSWQKLLLEVSDCLD